MTYFADLQPYTYWPSSTENALTIGWLDEAHEFATGSVPNEVVPALLELALNGMVNRTRGFQKCKFCTDPAYPVIMRSGDQEVALGSAEVRVTGADGTTYAAPTLIAHYIAEHDYLPPTEFIEALLKQP